MPVIHANGVDLSFEVRGDGPPLLLIAGTGQAGATWAPDLLGRLAAQYTVITYDHRGTGGTPDTKGEFSTRQFGSDAAGLLDALGMDPAHVVGHSMGGRVAQWLALDHPERVRSLTLAASGPGAYPGQFGDDADMPRGIPLGLAVALCDVGYERFIKDRVRSTFFTEKFLAADPPIVEWLVSAFWEHGPSVEAYLKHVIARQNHQTADRLHELGMPTLVLIGDADVYEGFAGTHWDQSMYLAQHIPGAHLEVLKGMAHGYFWQDPVHSGDALLEWLRRR